MCSPVPRPKDPPGSSLVCVELRPILLEINRNLCQRDNLLFANITSSSLGDRPPFQSRSRPPHSSALGLSLTHLFASKAPSTLLALPDKKGLTLLFTHLSLLQTGIILAASFFFGLAFLKLI